eukprot:PhM_4_TR17075/c0_g1_i3/m.87200
MSGQLKLNARGVDGLVRLVQRLERLAVLVVQRVDLLGGGVLLLLRDHEWLSDHNGQRTAMGNESAEVTEPTATTVHDNGHAVLGVHLVLPGPELGVVRRRVDQQIVFTKHKDGHNVRPGLERHPHKPFAALYNDTVTVGRRLQALASATENNGRRLARAVERSQDVLRTAVRGTGHDGQLAPERHDELIWQRLNAAPDAREQVREMTGFCTRKGDERPLGVEAVRVRDEEVVARRVQRGTGATHSAVGEVVGVVAQDGEAAEPLRRAAERRRHLVEVGLVDYEGDVADHEHAEHGAEVGYAGEDKGEEGDVRAVDDRSR